MQLSDQEKRILKTVSEAKANSQTIHRLSEDFGIPVDVLTRTVSDLASKKMIYLSQPKQHGNRYLKLTDKGECYSILHCGVEFDPLMDNHPYLESAKHVKSIRSAVHESLRTSVSKICVQFLVDKNFFDSEGSNKFSKQNFMWDARAILLEWSRRVKDLSIQNPGQIDLKKWGKFVKTIDEDIKIDSLLGTSLDRSGARVIQAEALTSAVK